MEKIIPWLNKWDLGITSSILQSQSSGGYKWILDFGITVLFHGSLRPGLPSPLASLMMSPRWTSLSKCKGINHLPNWPEVLLVSLLEVSFPGLKWSSAPSLLKIFPFVTGTCQNIVHFLIQTQGNSCPVPLCFYLKNKKKQKIYFLKLPFL